jgi:hypothetical protein
MKTGDVLNFDDAIEYLTTLLSKCDASVLAHCINFAAKMLNNTGKHLYVIAHAGQGVELTHKEQSVAMHELECVLEDGSGEGKRTVRVRAEYKDGWLSVCPEGYGDKGTADGFGAPIGIELWEDNLRAVIYGDINQEDPTHIISLEDAREDKREQDWTAFPEVLKGDGEMGELVPIANNDLGIFGYVETKWVEKIIKALNQNEMQGNVSNQPYFHIVTVEQMHHDEFKKSWMTGKLWTLRHKGEKVGYLLPCFREKQIVSALCGY